MFGTTQNAEQYWDQRSELFAAYYKKPSLFDKVFRKGIFTRIAVALKTCRDLEAPTVLDVGSGPGINSITLLKNSDASRLTGVDCAQNMVDYAVGQATVEGVGDKCQFVKGDFFDYDFGSKTFDLTIALGVLDYIEDSRSFIAKMGHLTNKAMVVSWPENGLRMFLRRCRYDCPVYHYTESNIKSNLEQCRFSRLDVVRSAGGWVTVGWK